MNSSNNDSYNTRTIGRAMRTHEIYAAACVVCGNEIESRTLPVPLRCPACEEKRVKSLLLDKPSPVRSTT